jgi:hypothetical protein
MPLSEGVSARLAYKAYSSGVITANSQPSPQSEPGPSGGQILRRVSSTLALAKDTYQSAEIRSDRQIADFRHGTRRVNGNVAGEFSPGTYWDLLEAAFRGTAGTAISKTNADYTSVEASASASTITLGSGDPVTDGFRVGDIIRLSSATANNDKNFLITGFSGSNLILSVYPAPVDMGADTSFTIATVGESLYVPSSSHVSRKFAFEIWNENIDVARLFKECRVGGFNMQLPATGLSTIEFTVMGRDMELYQDSNSPFFTSPAAASSTGIFAAVNGLLRVNGSVQGVVTGLNIQMNLSPSSDAVVGQNFVPEIFLGRANVSGQVTAFFEDGDLVNNFLDEDEIDILAYLTTTNDDNSPAVSIYLPRVKFGAADVQTAGEGGQTISMPFQALLYSGAGAGVEDTTIRIVDTQAA